MAVPRWSSPSFQNLVPAKVVFFFLYFGLISWVLKPRTLEVIKSKLTYHLCFCVCYRIPVCIYICSLCNSCYNYWNNILFGSVSVILFSLGCLQFDWSHWQKRLDASSSRMKRAIVWVNSRFYVLVCFSMEFEANLLYSFNLQSHLKILKKP